MLAILITAFCKSWFDQIFMTCSVCIKITNETILKNAYIKWKASLSLTNLFPRSRIISFFWLPGELGYNHEQLVIRHLRKDKMSARVDIFI